MEVRGFSGVVFLLLLLSAATARAQQHRITNTSDTALAATISLGTLFPAQNTNVSSSQVQFRLRSRQNGTGYRVDASSTFSVAPTSVVEGGSTLTASDIGVGISLSYSAGVITPRVDTIAAGFNYNPGSVVATNGLTPFTGAASGRATLSDLAAGVKLLSGPRFATQTNNASAYGLVTLSLGVVPQYFTPATFSGVITLTISNGP
jgi:hypothetical protein